MSAATSPDPLEAVVRAYVRALNARDLEAIVTLYADEATVEDPVGTEPLRGREAIRAFYARSVALSLEVRLEGQVRVAERLDRLVAAVCLLVARSGHRRGHVRVSSVSTRNRTWT